MAGSKKQQDPATDVPEDVHMLLEMKDSKIRILEQQVKA